MTDPLLLRVLDDAAARQLPVLIAEWEVVDDHRRWIARALRIDLALLTERPELVVPCLYRRCATVGMLAGEDAYFDKRPALAHVFAPLRDWIHRVTDEWSPGRRWLRALRSPAVPLDGAVIEEYRTGAVGRLWCSDDGELIGIAGESTIAWQRASGRRIAEARARPAVEPTGPVWQRIARESNWGRTVLARGDRRVTIEHGDDNIVDVRELSERYVFVRGHELDYLRFHGVIDTVTASFAWQTSGECAAMVPLDDRRIAVAHDGEIGAVALATGEREAIWECPYLGELVVLPDGNFAVRTGHVIRIWDRGLAAHPQVRPIDDASWLRLAYSPDGARLFTGRVLCDARTGRAITRIACNSPRGWLEGAPPRDCQRLCDGVFVELLPFGLRVWDTERGDPILADNDRLARAFDSVAFDPAGRYYAIWREDGRLAVCHLRDGALVRELTEPISDDRGARHLAFSADGDTLAWRTAGGTDRALSLADPTAPPRTLAAGDDPRAPPPPPLLPVVDGVLVVGDAAIPCNDPGALPSPDGTTFASISSHYRLEG